MRVEEMLDEIMFELGGDLAEGIFKTLQSYFSDDDIKVIYFGLVEKVATESEVFVLKPGRCGAIKARLAEIYRKDPSRTELRFAHRAGLESELCL